MLSPATLFLASCGSAQTGDNAATEAAPGAAFAVEEMARFNQPWAMDFDEATGALIVTEMRGTIRLRLADGRLGTVSGAPEVDYGDQGGLGDIRFAPGQGGPTLDGRVVYLTWAEAGEGDTRGAVLGKGRLACRQETECALENLRVIWRQVPKVSGRGHYSHRIAFSPDGRYLFISSGERQKMTPAQDLSNNLGTIVRLLPDGSPAPGNPWADRPSPTNQIWSYGHRNILGLAFDEKGRLWALEHGPRGGDELNLIEPGRNYGWPLVSNGIHYNGDPIPDHDTRPDLAAPAISWTPVIAPGDYIFYSGSAFPEWRGQAIITGLVATGLIRVRIDGDQAIEVARHPFDHRIREVRQGADGAIWLLEDGEEAVAGRLLRLTPASPPRAN
jgi:glucose/arabinose dehydrogenase